MLGDQLWCQDDYAANHYPKCDGCGDPILPDDAMLKRAEKQFHRKCVRCEVCGELVGDAGFLLIGDKLMCKVCPTKLTGGPEVHVQGNRVSFVPTSGNPGEVDAMDAYNQLMASGGYVNPYAMGANPYMMGQMGGQMGHPGQMTPEMLQQQMQLQMQMMQQMQMQGGYYNPSGMY